MASLTTQTLSACKPDSEGRPRSMMRVSGAAVTQPLRLQGMPWRCTQEHNFPSQEVSRVSQRVLQDLGEWSVRALSLDNAIMH